MRDRRAFLFACAATLYCPPSSRGAEVEDVRLAHFDEPIDLKDIPPGGWCQLIINGNLFFIRRRTELQIQMARAEPVSNLLDPERDEDRASHAEWLVVSGECTHAGCRVVAGLGEYQGWECLCHGSQFDISGRVRHGPAKRNLAFLRYEMQDSKQLVLHPPRLSDPLHGEPDRQAAEGRS